MTNLNIYAILHDAYASSTPSRNLFAEELARIPWTDRFEADGELYFSFGSLLLTVPSLDPFASAEHPLVIFPDGSFASL